MKIKVNLTKSFIRLTTPKDYVQFRLPDDFYEQKPGSGIPNMLFDITTNDMVRSFVTIQRKKQPLISKAIGIFNRNSIIMEIEPDLRQSVPDVLISKYARVFLDASNLKIE